MTKKLNVILLLIFVPLIGYSQKIHFQHITSSNGLSQSEVYSFLEDSQGFMWFGTLYGLNRYDGYNMLTFHSDRSNPNSLSNNTVRSLAEDNSKRVWIGTDNGLNVYKMETDKIHKINITELKDKRLNIYSIILDDQNLIISTSSGLLKANIETDDLDKIGQSFETIHYSDNYDKRINIIKRDKNGMIWVAVGNSLFSLVFIDQYKKPVIIDYIKDDRLTGVRDMAFDQSNNLWITTHSEGFIRYNTSEKSFDFFKENTPNNTVVSSNTSAVECDPNGNIWIGTRDKGLLFLSKENLNKENPEFKSVQKDPFDERSLNSNLIYSLYFSKNNLLWVGTIGSGINIYDPQQKAFNYYRIPPNMVNSQSGSNFIRSVYTDKNNNIWIGTHSNGLYLFDRNDNKFIKAGFGTESVFYITPLNENSLIVCSGAGVSIVEVQKGYKLSIKNAPINAASFFALKSKENIVWIASLDGLYRCLVENNQLKVDKILNVNSKPNISTNNSRVLFYASNSNEMYLGTEGGGLNVLLLDNNHEVESIKVYKKNKSTYSLSSNFIRSIIQSQDQTLWIGTYEGLNKVIRQKSTGSLSFQNYTIKDGLPNNMIQLMEEDIEGNIWLGTNRGLCKFNPVNEKFIRYSTTDGIQSNEFSEHAVYKNSDGEIVAGGTHGFNTFYPQKIHASNHKPTTTITGFFLFNKMMSVSNDKSEESPLSKSITNTDSLFLKPQQNNLGFEFSSLIYSNPEKVQYAYMLTGIDSDWNYTDSYNRRVNYINLKYGDYVFKVKSTNNDGEWEEATKEIYIHIDTPFYLSWLAYVIYVVIIIMVVVYFTNYTVIKYTTKKKILLESEHNQQLHELDEVRTRFFINISHDLRTPITLISNPLSLVLKEQDLKEKTRNRLVLAKKNVQKLRYITEQLLDINKAEAGKLVFKPKNSEFISFIKLELSHFTDAIKSKGLGVFIVTDHNYIHCQFDPDMISKIFFNIMSNAIKYTKKGEINVRIDLVTNNAHPKIVDSEYENFIKMEIQDSGKGISPAELDKIFDRFYQGHNKDVDGYGIGLSHCKDLVEAHEGIIEASCSEVGTIFSVFIPHLESTNIEDESIHSSNSTPDFYFESPLDIKHKDYSPTENQRQNILIIEDNVDMRVFIKEELSNEYKIVEAEDGVDGLTLAEKHLPDLIISDIMMPHMDGLELCKKLKSNIKTSHIPIILLTAKGDMKTKYRSIEIGADDYIAKPFDIEYLILRIRNLLSSKELQRNAFEANVKLSPSSIEVDSLDNKFLSDLMAAIEEGIPNPDFTVNTLESKMGMSHTNFYRKIKNLTGKSGKEILMDMRMKRARQTLADSEGIRISDVAYSVGFTNPKYFSKCFKEYYGILPSNLNEKTSY